jgi:nicotinamide riboside transporter PnuC
MIDAGSSTAYSLTISIEPITQVLAEFYLVAPITGIHYYTWPDYFSQAKNQSISRILINLVNASRLTTNAKIDSEGNNRR